MRLVLLGIALGLLGFLGLGRGLASQLYGLEFMDPLTALIVMAALATVGLLACLVPALRAARVDPSVALRSE